MTSRRVPGGYRNEHAKFMLQLRGCFDDLMDPVDVVDYVIHYATLWDEDKVDRVKLYDYIVNAYEGFKDECVF